MAKSLRFILLLMLSTANLGHVKCQDYSSEMTPTTGAGTTGEANSNEMTTTTGTPSSNEMTWTTGAETEMTWTGTGGTGTNGQFTETTAAPTTTSGPSNLACPVELTTLKINVSKLIGAWFTIESYAQVPAVNRSCEFSNVTYDSPNSFRTNTFQFNAPTSSSSSSSEESSGEPVNSYFMTVNRKFFLQHVDVQCTTNQNIQITNWRILAANFKEYAIHYACAFENGQFLGQRVDIVSRYPNPSSKVMAKAYKALERFGLSTTPLVKISQNPNTCKQFPEYQNILGVNQQMLNDWKQSHHKKHSKN